MSAWEPIETAPKDGTQILAFCVHANARLAGEDFDEWTEIVTTRWTDFNGGGWTWTGICGVHTHWQPLPPPPEVKSEAVVQDTKLCVRCWHPEAAHEWPNKHPKSCREWVDQDDLDREREEAMHGWMLDPDMESQG